MGDLRLGSVADNEEVKEHAQRRHFVMQEKIDAQFSGRHLSSMAGDLCYLSGLLKSATRIRGRN